MSIAVGMWLGGTAACTAGVILYGGYTRLMRAGLSMIDWKPHKPRRPATEPEWEEEFSRYKATPDYTVNFPDLSLEEFQRLYNIEWSHRIYARSLGLVFAVPMIGFWATGRFVGRDKMKMIALLGLGGLQGAMGWIMVKSGLTDDSVEPGERARVVPYKLAAHQITGMSLYSLLLWNSLNHLRGPPKAALHPSAAKARPKIIGILHCALATIWTGAFMSGNDASTVMINWPFYGDSWLFPANAWDREPKWRNFIENKGMVQFVHRNLAHLTYLLTLNLWWKARAMQLPLVARMSIHSLMLISTLQVALGIRTLYTNSQFELALAHQGTGLAFLSTILFAMHTVRRF